jgi:hypothetical protein
MKLFHCDNFHSQDESGGSSRMRIGMGLGAIGLAGRLLRGTQRTRTIYRLVKLERPAIMRAAFNHGPRRPKINFAERSKST